MTKTDNSSRPRKKRALGRGLSALIPDSETISEDSADFFQCDIDLIEPNRYQPRTHFAPEELNELKESIEKQGIIQPLLVRKADSGYELVAGERRLRASKMAGLETVPVVVKDLTDTELLEIAIVENIQRENLNPIEEADAYKRLMDEFGLTQDQVAASVGKSRSAVANFMRLLRLPETIKQSMMSDKISMGHARALLSVDSERTQLKAWTDIIEKKLSVRQTEALIKKIKTADHESLNQQDPQLDSETIYFNDIANNLSLHFGTKVNIKKKGKNGKLEIDFYSNADLERVLSLLQIEQ